MRTRHTGRRWVRLRRIGFWILVALPIAVVGGWLALRYIPSWYRPVVLSSEELVRVKGDIAGRADWISHRMVAERSFELILHDYTINEWLAALPHAWPDAWRVVPPELTDPVIRFEPGGIILAAHCAKDGWEAIISVRVEVAVSADGDAIDVGVTSVRGGVLPMPSSVIDRLLESLGHSELNPESDDHRLHLPNKFDWPNGDRRFRIESIAIEEGAVRIVVEPL